jgi:transcriptional regulator with XRE-family HTH domain
MDIERNSQSSLGQRVLDHLDGVPKVKSPLRLRYAAETKVFRDQHGGLEEIRLKLGFSRRKMCQLLLVDPSAWTRWMRDESRVPPHIYRSLEWFLALNHKMLTEPDLAAVVRMRSFAAPLNSAEPGVLRAEVDSLRRTLARHRKVSMVLGGGLIMLNLLYVAFFVRL